jgi:hypothetical protein
MAVSRLDQEMERETAETLAKIQLHALLSKLEDWVSQDALLEHQIELQANIDWIDDVSKFQKKKKNYLKKLCLTSGYQNAYRHS